MINSVRSAPSLDFSYFGSIIAYTLYHQYYLWSDAILKKEWLEYLSLILLGCPPTALPATWKVNPVRIALSLDFSPSGSKIAYTL